MFYLGEYVKINGTNIEGFIKKISNKNVSILYNDKLIKSNINNIEKSNNIPKEKENFKVNVNISSPPVDEIMIRHLKVDEALLNLDKFIDNAISNNVKIIKIIHGKNGGILRKAVHKYLEESPYVKEHRLGGYYEGSYGVTIAFLK